MKLQTYATAALGMAQTISAFQVTFYDGYKCRGRILAHHDATWDWMGNTCWTNPENNGVPPNAMSATIYRDEDDGDNQFIFIGQNCDAVGQNTVQALEDGCLSWQFSVGSGSPRWGLTAFIDEEDQEAEE